MPRPPNTSPQTIQVLRILAGSESEWQHGYAISKQTGLAQGTLSPLLKRLEILGWLESRWETDNHLGPPRKYVRITLQGFAALRNQPKNLEKLR